MSAPTHNTEPLCSDKTVRYVTIYSTVNLSTIIISNTRKLMITSCVNYHLFIGLADIILYKLMEVIFETFKNPMTFELKFQKLVPL